MSEALFETGGLRFWNEDEINYREHCIKVISSTIQKTLGELNRAWMFRRCEAPILIAKDRLPKEYDGDDVFILQAELASKEFCLRPETTPSSYVVAKKLIHNFKPPLCVWQVGKSFRREKSDGASPSKLRFNEFYQMEFQCIYSIGTKADYKTAVVNSLLEILPLLLSKNVRAIDSDRLPSYSKHTLDIEAEFNGDWKEICSISTRTDFSDKEEVLEIAFGLDRLIEVHNFKNEIV